MTEISASLDSARDRLREQAQASPYLTVPEVAQLARCEHKAVRKAVHDGLLPAFNPERKLLIRATDAVSWIESRPVRAGTRSQAPARSRPRARSVTPGEPGALRQLDPDLAR
jgi:hypothetical protein